MCSLPTEQARTARSFQSRRRSRGSDPEELLPSQPPPPRRVGPSPSRMFYNRSYDCIHPLTPVLCWSRLVRTMVDIALVKAWLSEVQEEIKAKQQEVLRLQNEIAADSARESALRALLSAGSAKDDLEATLEFSRSSERQAPDEGQLHPVEAAALDVLRERGKPFHISEIRTELLRRMVPIPGKGTDANVIVYLSRSPRVCRVGRGLYALKEWGVPEVPRRHRRSTTGKRGRRRKPQRKSSKS
jgi:hypothetical protein